ncbi:MAG: hypothetical protein HN956_20815, partial [Rhodospirillaceae bacterium]|nr:hypothetical protein [Rhodospirillaceae bacterium]
MSDLSTYTREDSRLAAVPLPQKDGLPVPRHGIRSQLILLAGLLGLSLVLTMASLFWSGYSQDKIALENSRHLAGTALKVQLSTLQKIITDYTYWDEAYLKTVEKFDPSWFDENFADGEYLGDTFGITTTFVVNSHNKILRHMRNSEIFENPSQLDTADYFKDGISKLIKTARHSIDGEFEAAAGLVKMDRQFYIATARVIHPHSDALLAKAAVTPSNAFVVAVMRPLGSALLEKIAEDFGLQDLRFVRSDDPSSRLPLQIMEGERFGALAWEIDLPSKYVMEVILPGFLAVIISVGWLGWYGLNSLRQSQMQQFAAMQQAQIADRSKTEFLANMSHE